MCSEWPFYNRRMPATKILMTAEEFDSYPFEEDKRYELDEGEFIEPMKGPAEFTAS